MATRIIPGNVVSVKAWCTSQEQASVNTYFYESQAEGIALTTDQDVADSMEAILGSLYKDILTPTSSLNGFQVQIVDSGGVPVPLNAAVSNTSGSGPGVVVGSELPRQVSGLLSWTTRFAGRKFRGRTYFPFPPVAFDTGTGVPTSAAVAAYNAIGVAVNAYVTDPVTGMTFLQVLYHRGTPNSVPPIFPSNTPITGGSVSPKWATQRRRGSFGRANISPI